MKTLKQQLQKKSVRYEELLSPFDYLDTEETKQKLNALVITPKKAIEVFKKWLEQKRQTYYYTQTKKPIKYKQDLIDELLEDLEH